MGNSREMSIMELPPRARRIRLPLLAVPGICGTTSACAENTVRLRGRAGADWNYLRVRGEYSRTSISCSSKEELPPRARRIQFLTRLRLGMMVNYLRVRGEYLAW